MTAGTPNGTSGVPRRTAGVARSDACRTILQDIAAYLDGELDATECGRIDEHCQACEACRAIVGGLRETVGLCREVSDVPLPEPVRARALDSVRRLLASRDR